MVNGLGVVIHSPATLLSSRELVYTGGAALTAHLLLAARSVLVFKEVL